MDGYRVRKPERCLGKADIVVTCTGNRRVVSRDQMENQMKDGCVVCNMGHSNTEIEVQALKTPDVTWVRVRPNVDHVLFKSGKKIVLLAEGRLLNMATTSVSSFAVSVNACTQV